MRGKIAVVSSAMSAGMVMCGGVGSTFDGGVDATADAAADDAMSFGESPPKPDAGYDSGGTVFASQQLPLAIAVDSTNVYWTTTQLGGGDIMECPITGCGGPPLRLASNQGDVLALGSSGATVYWPSAGAIMRCDIGGCANAPAVLNAAPQAPGLSVSSGTVYWTETAAPDAGRVVSCATSGCNNAPTVIASGQVNPRVIAVDSTNVYWSTDGTGPNSVGLGVWMCPATGCAGSPTQLWNGVAGGIASNGVTVAWTANGSVMTCPTSGCVGNPTVLASGLNQPMRIAIDGATAYWLTKNAVMKCALAGCASNPIVLATGDYVGQGIAVTATTLFWADSFNDALMSLTPK